MGDQIERLTAEDLAGSGAAREHVPALLERLNLLVDRANAGGDSGLTFETIAALRAQSTEGFLSGRAAIVKAAQIGGEGPAVAVEFLFAATVDATLFAATDEARAEAEAALVGIPNAIWQTTKVGAWLGALPAAYNGGGDTVSSTGKLDEAIFSGHVYFGGETGGAPAEPILPIDEFVAPFAFNPDRIRDQDGVYLDAFLSAAGNGAGAEGNADFPNTTRHVFAQTLRFKVRLWALRNDEFVAHDVSPAIEISPVQPQGRWSLARVSWQITKQDLTPPEGFSVVAWGLQGYCAGLNAAIVPHVVLTISNTPGGPPWVKL